MFTAIMYVWPQTPMMQLRAGVCVLAIAIMRLLNLAVPILYRDVVNTLADASSAAHPRAGETPESTSFWHVSTPARVPWQCENKEACHGLFTVLRQPMKHIV